MYILIGHTLHNMATK